MGVLTMELEKVNKTITDSQKEVERLQRKLERAKEEKENKKQYERDLKIAVENDLKNCFYNCFEREGLEKGLINLSLKVTRDEIIQNVGESETEKNYIDDNYEKILNKIKKVYINDQKAKNAIIAHQLKQQQEKELQEMQEQEKKSQKWIIIFNIIGSILKWACIILFGGIYLIFKFCCELANDQGKRK